MRRLPAILIAGLIVASCLVGEALGCPNCKDSLSQNDPTATGLVQGYFWSILFMLAMPFTILAGMSTYFYLLVRQARTAATAAMSPQAGGNPFAPSAAEPTSADTVPDELLV